MRSAFKHSLCCGLHALFMSACSETPLHVTRPTSLSYSDNLNALAETVASPEKLLDTILYPPNERVRQCLKFGQSRCPTGPSEGIDIVRKAEGHEGAPHYEVLAGSPGRPVYFAETGAACQSPDPSLCSYTAFPIAVTSGFISDGLGVAVLFCSVYRLPEGKLAKSRMPQSSACEALGVSSASRGILGPFDRGFPFVWHSVLQESIITESLF